jgi:hypothetical protein
MLVFRRKRALEPVRKADHGDRYEAWTNGPVPQFAYDLMRFRVYRLDAESLEAVRQALSFSGDRRRMTAKREADLMVFSRTDMACLDRAIERYDDLRISELARVAHEDPAYRATRRDDTIDYESMVDPQPDRDEFIADLRDTAAYVVL